METREWGYNVDVFLAYNNPMCTKLGCAKSTFTNEAPIIICQPKRNYYQSPWYMQPFLILLKMICVLFSFQNDLTFLRIRSKKHEIMIAPGEKIMNINVFYLLVFRAPSL